MRRNAKLTTASASPSLPNAPRSMSHRSAAVPTACGVIATRYHQDRALAPAELAAMFRAATSEIPIETAPDLATALARIRDPAGPFHRAPSGPVIHPRPEVLITGSLFVVGEARTLLLGAPTDPYVVTDPPP